MRTTRSAWRYSLWLVVWLAVSDRTPFPIRGEPPNELTKQQHEQRKERDKLEAQAKSLEREAEWHQWLDNIAAARKARQGVLALRTTIHGEKHWMVTDARLALADVEILGRLTPPQRRRLAEAGRLDEEALALYQQGKYREAMPLARRAVEIEKQVRGEKHLDYAISLNSLAVLHFSLGDYAKAEPLYQQAREIRKRLLGEKHPYYAQSLNNLAQLYGSVGDYTRAERNLREARDIFQQTLGETHAGYATSLDNLAGLYDFLGDYAKAEPLFCQALEIRRQARGVKDPDYAISLNNLGQLYVSMGDYAKAETRLREALEFYEAARGEKHPRYATGLSNLAKLYSSMGDYAKAEPLCQKALALSRDNLERAAAGQSEREQLATLADMRYRLDAYLSLAAEAKLSAERLYEPVLAWKGAVSLRQRHQRLARRHPELATDFTALDRVASRLATLALAVPDPKRLEAHRRQIQELSEEKERLESKLAGLSAEFRKEKELRRLTPSQLQTVLPKEAALLDFLEYTRFTPPAEKKGKYHKERRLVAFVVRRDGLARVDLGPSKSVTEAIDRWRLALQRRFRTKGDEDLATVVRQLIWQPLEKHLRGARLVLISPDRDLARVPFAALPGGKKDSLLLEELAIAVVPVPQLLPELLAARPGAGEPSLLLVGDVRYDGAGGVAAGADSRTAARRSADALFRWPALANTRAEIEAIADAFQRRSSKGGVTRLSQAEASEDGVRQQAPAHRYLHFATHGYFAPTELRSALVEVSRSNATSALNLFGARGVAGFHPGLLSGLVLAGANRPIDALKEDGILTALEIEALDFRGVELATLSACETGLGEVAGGEGLLGLQRAFQVAGARSVVAGLWQVDDAATRQLMVLFYDNLWRKKLPKLEALRQAQLWMLREGDGWMRKEGVSRGMIDVRVPKERLAKEDGRLPPYYWAAFALSGDWR